MTQNAEIIRTTHLPQLGVHFGSKNQYKIVLNIVKKNLKQFMMPIKTLKIETIVLYFAIKKTDLRPENETKSLRMLIQS